ncbi:MAG: hypothetical protein ACR2FF_05515 [Mycobacteriales bacterium]
MTEEPIPLPDGETISRDEGFQSWLAMNDYLIECEFLVYDVEGMPENPYSEQGLRVAEADFLRRFASAEDMLTPENREMFGKFIRFVGEVFVHALGFGWTNKPTAFDDGKPYLGIEHPAVGQIDVPRSVTAAVYRRSADEWGFVFRNMKEDIEAADR